MMEHQIEDLILAEHMQLPHRSDTKKVTLEVHIGQNEQNKKSTPEEVISYSRKKIYPDFLQQLQGKQKERADD